MSRIPVLISLLIVLMISLAVGGAYLGKQTSQPSPFPTPTPPSNIQDCKIAGCSNQVCVDAKEAEEFVTDCEWKAEYACYKQVCNPPGCKTARCERQRSGECGWTQDEALVKCLKELDENTVPAGIE